MKTIAIASMLFCFSWHVNAQQTETMAKRIQSMAKEKDPQKNVASMRSIIKEYKLDTVKNAEDIDMMKGEIAFSFLKIHAFSKFEDYISLIKNKFNQTSYLNMAAALLSRNNLNYAEVIAEKTVLLYDSYKNDPLAKPTSFPLEDWNRFMRMAAYPYYDTYAKILHAKSKYKEAFFYLERALKDQELQHIDQSSIALYTALLEIEQQADKAYDILLKMAKVGKSNINMNAQLKRLYIQKSGSEANATLFLDSLQKNVKEAYKNELAKKMMVNVEAPAFTLFDLSGNRVALTSLKGKIIVLDFWATWCAPCIASMPAMKKMSELHPEVVFLFIATQEPGNNATARVKNYVKNNKFPLNVLMDEKKSTVASAYNVTGIPTKVVIDKKGKLRFTTNGYRSDTELINELEAMIAIAKAQ